MAQIPLGMYWLTGNGMPAPKLTQSPALISSATRLAISSSVRGFLEPWCIILPPHDSVNVNPRCVNLGRVEAPHANDVFHLGDDDLCRRSHDGVKILSGIPVFQVTPFVGHMSFEESNIGLQRRLQNTCPAVNDLLFLILCE